MLPTCRTRRSRWNRACAGRWKMTSWKCITSRRSTRPTGRIIGAEGLMRWNHPQRGLLSAGEFLPFAEENGLMLPISRLDAEARCAATCCCGMRQASERVRLSLNVSPQYLDRGDFFEKMSGALIALRDFAGADRGRDHREHLHPQSAVRDRAAQQAVPARRVGGDRRLRHRLFVAGLPAPLPDPHHQDRPVLRQGDPRRAWPLPGDAGDHLDRARARPAPGRRRRRDRNAGGYLEQVGCTTMQGFLYYRPVSSSQFLQLLRKNAARCA